MSTAQFPPGVGQSHFEGAVGDGNLGIAVGFVFLKETTVEEGDLPDEFLQKSAAVDADDIYVVRGIQPGEEKVLQSIATEVRLTIPFLAVIFPQRTQIIKVGVEREPPFLFEEADKEQTVEDLLREESFRIPFAPCDAFFSPFKDTLVFAKEPFGDSFDIEGTLPLEEPSLMVIPVPDLKATNSFSRISDSGDLLRISSRLIQIWYQVRRQASGGRAD